MVACLIIHTFRLVFSAETVFFSHNKSARTVFSTCFFCKTNKPKCSCAALNLTEISFREQTNTIKFPCEPCVQRKTYIGKSTELKIEIHVPNIPKQIVPANFWRLYLVQSILLQTCSWTCCYIIFLKHLMVVHVSKSACIMIYDRIHLSPYWYVAHPQLPVLNRSTHRTYSWNAQICNILYIIITFN